jgi:molybdopterin-guanine dinucleotide biosynthesis protein A
MGRDKATMPVGGVELGRAVIGVAAQLADPVVVVAPDGHPAVALAAGIGVAHVADPGQGPLAAVAAALAAPAAGDARHLLVLAADHPDLRFPLLSLLLDLRGLGEAVACRRGPRFEPLVAVYERGPALATARDLLAGGGGRSLQALLDRLRTRVVEEAEWRAADPDGASFLDLDEPGDLAAFRARTADGGDRSG